MSAYVMNVFRSLLAVIALLCGGIVAAATCDVATPVVPCEVGTMVYDSFVGNYTGTRAFYRAASYDAVANPPEYVNPREGTYLCLILKDGLPHTEGYAFAANYGTTVWISPEPYNIPYGVFGQFNQTCIFETDHFVHLTSAPTQAVAAVTLPFTYNDIVFNHAYRFRSNDSAEHTCYYSNPRPSPYVYPAPYYGVESDAMYSANPSSTDACGGTYLAPNTRLIAFHTAPPYCVGSFDPGECAGPMLACPMSSNTWSSFAISAPWGTPDTNVCGHVFMLGENICSGDGPCGDGAVATTPFTWPVDPVNPTGAHDGPCSEWSGDPQGCVWLSDTSENASSVWRDVQPFQRHDLWVKVKGKQVRRGFHLGADYNLGGGPADRGLPVYAAADGRLRFAPRNVCGWGNILFVEHDTAGGPVTTMYAHVDWIDQKNPPPVEFNPPLPVKRGEQIAVVGDGRWTKTTACGSQDSYAYHLHFEVRLGNDSTAMTPGPAYTSDRLAEGVLGPQRQVDPNLFISAHR